MVKEVCQPFAELVTKLWVSAIDLIEWSEKFRGHDFKAPLRDGKLSNLINCSSRYWVVGVVVGGGVDCCDVGEGGWHSVRTRTVSSPWGGQELLQGAENMSTLEFHSLNSFCVWGFVFWIGYITPSVYNMLKIRADAGNFDNLFAMMYIYK